MKKNPGFSLMGLLVAVVVIAVLAAVATPLYKRAVLKSRFASLMPMAKAVADAQEVYYLNNQLYSSDPQTLDVAPVTSGNTSVTLSETNGYDYVLVKRWDMPEVHYIIYQQHSPHYSGEIHCEAQTGSATAAYLCQSMGGGVNIGTTLTPGYTTYVISGAGGGIPPVVAYTTTCDTPQAMGYDCMLTVNTDGTALKRVCYRENYCVIYKYDAQDNIIATADCVMDNGVCRQQSEKTYDAQGRLLRERKCSAFNEDGTCATYATSGNYDYAYDADGNRIRVRNCYTVAADGSCSAYSPLNNFDYTYDEYGHKTSERKCQTVEMDGHCSAYDSNVNYEWTYTYNPDGSYQVKERSCRTLASDGHCQEYNSFNNNDYTYGPAGEVTSRLVCNALAPDGSCQSYSYGYYYTYDERGNRLMQLNCQRVENPGHCSEYDGGYSYMYDTVGNLVREYNCQHMTPAGVCTEYNNYHREYTYDVNGKQLSTRYCQSVNPYDNCTAYVSFGNYDYAYDAYGNRMSELACNTVLADGTCTTYKSAVHYMYDEEGNRVMHQSCSGSDINTMTGECIGGTPIYDR